MTAQIDKLYDGYVQSALRFSQGDIQKSDYLLDTSVYMYFYRVVQLTEYSTWQAEQIKNQAKPK